MCVCERERERESERDKCQLVNTKTTNKLTDKSIYNYRHRQCYYNIIVVLGTRMQIVRYSYRSKRSTMAPTKER